MERDLERKERNSRSQNNGKQGDAMLMVVVLQRVELLMCRSGKGIAVEGVLLPGKELQLSVGITQLNTNLRTFETTRSFSTKGVEKKQQQMEDVLT